MVLYNEQGLQKIFDNKAILVSNFWDSDLTNELRKSTAFFITRINAYLAPCNVPEMNVLTFDYSKLSVWLYECQNFVLVFYLILYRPKIILKNLSWGYKCFQLCFNLFSSFVCFWNNFIYTNIFPKTVLV